MNVRDVLELFLGGLVLGHGPCLVFCAPIILPVVASTEGSWKGGLVSTLKFSAGRMLSYLFLALAASFSYAWLDNFILVDSTHFTVRLLLSILLVILAVLIMSGHVARIGSRGVLRGFTLSSPFVLGILVGLTPCAPLLGSLAYVAVRADGPEEGALLGLAFAIGTLLSPLLILGAVFGSLKRITGTGERALFVLRLAGSAVLFFFAVRLVLEAFSGRATPIG
jgi:sulfite exporter TauE/SafE